MIVCFPPLLELWVSRMPPSSVLSPWPSSACIQISRSPTVRIPFATSPVTISYMLMGGVAAGPSLQSMVSDFATHLAYLRALSWSAQPCLEMVLVLSYVLQRPISLLRYKSSPSNPEVSLTIATPTLAVCDGFMAWDPTADNSAHILLAFYANHYNPMPMVKDTGPTPTPLGLFTYSKALSYLDDSENATVVGHYHFNDEDPTSALLTVRRAYWVLRGQVLVCRATLDSAPS